MELLYNYAKECYNQHKNDEDELAPKRKKFNEVMVRMDELAIEIEPPLGDEMSFANQVINEG